MNEKILNYLKLKTLQMDWSSLDEFTSSALLIEFNLSRTLINQILKELYNHHMIIKIQNKPIYFFHKEMLEKKYHVSNLKDKYDSIEDIMNALQVSKTNNVFSELIGYRGSLRYCLEQCKASVMYPGNGLPVLLHGESGTGKSNLANLMFKYAKVKKVIDEEANMITINCAEYANNPELFLTNLFGYVKGAFTDAVDEKQGILSLCNGGYLFLDEVHCLSAECQEKIFLFMDKGIYHKVGDNENWYSSNVRIIFATTEEPKDCLLKTLLRRIVLIIEMPSFDNYSSREKREFLYRFILQETMKINQEILISKNAMQSLLQHHFSGNVGELKNVIRASVANAYVIQHEKVIIHTSNLPIEFLGGTLSTINHNLRESNIVSLDELCSFTVSNYQFNELNEYLLKVYKEYIEDNMLNDFWDKAYNKLEKFIDYLFFDKIEKSQIDTKLMEIIENMFHLLHQKHLGYQLSHIQLEIISRMISEMNEVSDAFILFQEEHQDEIAELLIFIKNNYSDEYNICYDFLRMIHRSVLFEQFDIHLIDFIVLLHYFGKNQNRNLTSAVIIAHGYSIASGIAEVANHMLEQKIFDALDMPFDVDLEHIVHKLITFLKQRQLDEELLILVDMGSLEEIHRYLGEHFPINIGIVNNVNTRLALDIGNRLKLGEPLEEILVKSTSANQCRYLYARNKVRKDVILSVCDTGRGTANIIAKLIEISMPKNKDILILPYDIGSIQNMKFGKKRMDKYNIISVVGTKNPHIDSCPFISIEELIYHQNTDRIAQLFQMKITKEEIEEFKKRITRNFSYQQITGLLEVIQPEKIIRDVDFIVDFLRKELRIVFSSGTTLLLYIHISCLVERLIMNKYLDKYENLEKFEEENKDFIKIVKKAFEHIELTYNVVIPISEIAYINDCLYKDNYQSSVSMNNLEIELFTDSND